MVAAAAAVQSLAGGLARVWSNYAHFSNRFSWLSKLDEFRFCPFRMAWKSSFLTALRSRERTGDSPLALVGRVGLPEAAVLRVAWIKLANSEYPNTEPLLAPFDDEVVISPLHAPLPLKV